MAKKRVQRISLLVFKMIVIILLILLVIGLGWRFKKEIWLLLHPSTQNRIRLLHLVRAHGSFDAILMTIVVALSNTISVVPNSAICIFVGVCYGSWLGILINWLGNILGNCLVVAVINHLPLPKGFRHNQLIYRVRHAAHPKELLTIFYMLPMIPGWLTNYVCAELKARPIDKTLIIAMGMLPISVLYAFGGDALLNKNWTVALICGAGLLLLLLGSWLLDHHSSNHSRHLHQSDHSQSQPLKSKR